MKRTFSHIPRFDERSREFGIRTLVGAKPRISNYWPCQVHLNQGSEGACTGFATAHDIAAPPFARKGVTVTLAKELYARAKQLDEWPGENYDGSSVLAAVKAARERKLLASYRWAFGEDDLALAIGYAGPVILGIAWLAGMEKPDANGRVRATGAKRGGHAILCNAYDAGKNLYRLHNSWGRAWGVAGACWIPAADMKKLLAMDGEACVPSKG
jgi:hypothetical protein